MPQRSGLTFIELMVAIAIVAIIIVTILVAVNPARRSPSARIDPNVSDNEERPSVEIP